MLPHVEVDMTLLSTKPSPHALTTSCTYLLDGHYQGIGRVENSLDRVLEIVFILRKKKEQAKYNINKVLYCNAGKQGRVKVLTITKRLQEDDVRRQV